MKKPLLLLALAAAAVALVSWRWPHLLRETPLEGLADRGPAVYRWQDVDGNWHLTDRPPGDGRPYEVERYPLDTNVLPSTAGKGDGD